MDRHTHNKALLAPLRQALYDFDPKSVRAAMADVIAVEAVVHLCHPFGDVTGPEAFFGTVFAELAKAWPDLERRDFIVVAGPDEGGLDWVGCGGYYTGTFLAPWLDIPPTGHQVSMRFHEFYRFENGKVVEVQAIWDIPEVMMQAGAWPLAPSLGREWLVPGPALQNGLVEGPRNEAQSQASCDLIMEMIQYLIKYPSQGGPEVMEADRFWHPKFNWYGPAGIGTARGISGFRNWHQIPFLAAMPDRGQYEDEITHHFFGDGAFAAVTGWPNMAQTHSADGWLGLPPTGEKIFLRSLDFWRVEAGKIRENWVLVDLLNIYNQLGLDVFARMREFNKARNVGPISVPSGMDT